MDDSTFKGSPSPSKYETSNTSAFFKNYTVATPLTSSSSSSNPSLYSPSYWLKLNNYLLSKLIPWEVSTSVKELFSFLDCNNLKFSPLIYSKS